MSKTVPDDVLGIAKPALDKRVEELIESAFKLAKFAECTDVLEKAIDRCTTVYFQNDPNPIDQIRKDVQREIALEGLKRTFGPPTNPQNLVTGRSLPPAPKLPRRVPIKEVVRASSFSQNGRPLSRYKGVSYSGSRDHPWVARYKTARCGVFNTEEEAAREYDRIRVQNGKPPVNFLNQ